MDTAQLDRSLPPTRIPIRTEDDFEMRVRGRIPPAAKIAGQALSSQCVSKRTTS